MRRLSRLLITTGAAGIVCTGLTTNALAGTTFEGNVNEFFMDIDNWSSGLRNSNHNMGQFDVDGDGVVFDPVNNPREEIVVSGLDSGDVDNELDMSSWDASTNRYSGFNKIHFGDVQPGQTSKLTVRSGILNPFADIQMNQLRDTTAHMVQEGGTVEVGSDFTMNHAQSNTTATYDYRGGTLEVGNRFRMGRSSDAGTSRIIIRNPDNGGRISVGGDFDMAESANSIATAEFHYANGGTRPVQIDGELSLRSFGPLPETRSPRLDLELDEAVGTNGEGVPENLGLFATGDGVGGISQGPNLFYDAESESFLEQGDEVSAEFGNTEYKWQISYEGDINFADPANSVVDSIAASGGDDVVLEGLSSVTQFVLGDMNGDGEVNNLDINPFVLALTDEEAFEQQFGTDPAAIGDINEDGQFNNLDINPFVSLLTGGSSLQAVPEPSSVALLGLGGLTMLRRRRRHQ